MAHDPPRMTVEPTDRLTRLCDAMTRALEAHPEYREGDKCCIFLDSDVDRMGGIVLHGYEDHSEAMANLFFHMKATFRAAGGDLDFIGIPESPEGLSG